MYTLLSYSFMRPGLKRAGVALMNLSNSPVTLNKGSVVAIVKAANVVPLMLAPKNEEKKDNVQMLEKTPE